MTKLETSQEYFERVQNRAEDWAKESIEGAIIRIPELKNLKYSEVEILKKRISEAYYYGYTQGKENL